MFVCSLRLLCDSHHGAMRCLLFVTVALLFLSVSCVCLQFVIGMWLFLVVPYVLQFVIGMWLFLVVPYVCAVCDCNVALPRGALCLCSL